MGAHEFGTRSLEYDDDDDGDKELELFLDNSRWARIKVQKSETAPEMQASSEKTVSVRGGGGRIAFDQKC